MSKQNIKKRNEQVKKKHTKTIDLSKQIIEVKWTVENISCEAIAIFCAFIYLSRLVNVALFFFVCFNHTIFRVIGKHI